MATLATVLTFARTQGQTDSNGLTDTNGIIFANEGLLDIHRQFISNGINASQLQEAYADFTAGTGTYLYPTNMFWLKTIELNYASANAQDYKTASRVDIANLSGNKSFSWLRLYGDVEHPKFNDYGDWFEVFPTPTSSNNTTQAIRIFYYLEPTEYTATSDTISYPVSLDYRILGLYITGSYYQSLNKFEEADRFFAKYDKRIKELIATLGRGSQQPIETSTIPLTGWEY